MCRVRAGGSASSATPWGPAGKPAPSRPNFASAGALEVGGREGEDRMKVEQVGVRAEASWPHGWASPGSGMESRSGYSALSGLLRFAPMI